MVSEYVTTNYRCKFNEYILLTRAIILEHIKHSFSNVIHSKGLNELYLHFDVEYAYSKS